jgi:hypothetical protein
MEHKMKPQNIDIFNRNKQLITNHVEIHSNDLNVLEISIRELMDAGVGLIRTISFEESDSYNWVMLLTNDEDQAFLLELSEYGNIVMLRKDGLHGEVVVDYLSGDFVEA